MASVWRVWFPLADVWLFLLCESLESYLADFLHVWKSSLFYKWYPIDFVHLCKVSEPSLVTSTCHNDWKLCHCTLMKEFKASEASDCSPWFLHSFKRSKQILTQSVGVCEATHGDAISASHHPPVAECRQGWSAHTAVRASWPGLTICVFQSRLLPGALPATIVFRDSLIHDHVSYIQWLSYVLILEIGRKGCLCIFIFPEEYEWILTTH